MLHFFISLQHRRTTGIVTLVLAALLIPSCCFAGGSGQILVTIEGIRAEQGGTLLVALYDQEGNWPKHDSALLRKSLAVSAATQKVGFEGLPSDSSYAVQVLHDRNRNGKLDFRWLPFPKPDEGVGVSNNNRRFGPPSYQKALFRLDGAASSIVIEMDY